MSYNITIQYKSKSSTVIKLDSFKELEWHVKDLDNEKYSLILTKDHENIISYSIVYNDLGYLCFYYDGDEWYLINKNIENEDDEIEVFIGHLTERPKKYLNNIERVLAETNKFLIEGKIDRNFWDEY